MIKIISKRVFSYLAILIIAVNIQISSARASAFGEVIDTLMNLTCETEGIHNLLMEPYTHSCIQDTFMTYIVSAAISGGIHTSMMLRLRLDDDKVFPGNCLRANRADPNNPTISFGMCSNLMMIVYRVKLVVFAIFAAITGDNPFAQIAKLVDSSGYTVKFNNKHDGDWGVFFDIGLGYPIMPWIVEERGDRICVSTVGATIIAGNWLHVGCKFIGEPYPESIYASFYRNTGTDYSHKLPPEMVHYMNCATAGGCAARGQVFSQASITLSGTIMECIREMLTKMLISSDVCVATANTNAAQISNVNSTFFQFQVNMQRAVMAFLTLYIMTVGLKILMGGADNIPKNGELFMHILKFLLVIYFSIGMNVGGDGPRFDGMTSFVFPVFLNAAAEIATWVSNATPSGLCRFLPSEYPQGMGYLSLWDALDCKVLHYIGIDTLTTMWQSQGASGSGDPLGNNIPPYIYFLIPAIVSKQINLVLLVLSFPLLVLSLAAYLVNSFAVCLIAIAILGIMAPIFVPMSLFDATKGYFQSWYTLMISFVLQPVVVVGFMTLMFSLYDSGFYGTCQYVPLKVLKTGPSGERLTKKLFIIDNDRRNYDSEESYKGCQESVGWILNNPLGAVAAQIAEASGNNSIDLSSAPESEKKMADYMRQFGVLSGIGPVAGFFFGYFALLANLSWQLIVNMLICCLLLYLMYELSDQLGNIAADLAQSVTLSGAIQPRAVSDAVKSAVKGGGKGKEDMPDGGDDKGGKGGPSMGKRGGASGAPSMGKGSSGKGSGGGSGGLSSGGSGGSAPTMGGGA